MAGWNAPSNVMMATSGTAMAATRSASASSSKCAGQHHNSGQDQCCRAQLEGHSVELVTGKGTGQHTGETSERQQQLWADCRHHLLKIEHWRVILR